MTAAAVPTRLDPHTGDVLALDPSVRSAGVALFRGGVLLAADTVKLESATGETPLARCLRMATEVCEWVARLPARPRILIAEWPGKSWRGDARDLHGLAGVSGAVAGVLSREMVGGVAGGVAGILALANAQRGVIEVVSVDVNEWSGSASKALTVRGAKTSPRGLRVARALAAHPGEAEVWASTKYHDAVDAIGLGLWFLGRYGERVYPGTVDVVTSEDVDEPETAPRRRRRATIR